jgi:conjugal transfer/entry exclusion protein
MIKNQLKDLAQLPGYPIVSIAQDLAALTQMLNRLKTLLPFDSEAIDQLFATLFPASVSAWCTDAGIGAWRGSASSWVQKAQHGAMLAQSLIDDIFELMGCITGIIDQALRITGSVQGLQVGGQLQSLIVHQDMRTTAMLGAFQSSLTMDKAYQHTQAQIAHCIHAKRMGGIVRSNPFGIYTP